MGSIRNNNNKEIFVLKGMSVNRPMSSEQHRLKRSLIIKENISK